MIYRYFVILSALISALLPLRAAVNGGTGGAGNLEKIEVGYDFIDQGIYYKFLGGDSVTTSEGDNPYVGKIVIPEEVNYGGETYRVTKVSGFVHSPEVTEITIPKYVTEITSFYGALYDISSMGLITKPEVEVDSTAVESKLTTIYYNATDCPKVGGQRVETNMFGGAIYYLQTIFPNTVTKVRIGENVQSIPDYLLYDCPKITELTMPKAVKKIGRSIGAVGLKKYILLCEDLEDNNWLPSGAVVELGPDFKTLSNGLGDLLGFTNATEYTIPSWVRKIGSRAFSGTNVSIVNIPSTVEAIAREAFMGTNLTKVSFSGNNITIGERAFQDTGIKSVELPKGVTEIGDYAFCRCENLETVVFPEALKTIGEDAFLQCSRLKEINLPNNLVTIGKEAFSGCKSITEIVIPNSVKYLGKSSFGGCPDLTSVVLGESVEQLGGFERSKIRSITIPKSVKYVAENAFHGVVSLTEVNISSIDSWAQIDFANWLANPLFYGALLKIDGNHVYGDIVLSDNVTKIGSFAFCGLRHMSSLTIPEGVTSIGEGAFTNCSNLKTINVNAVKFTSGRGLFHTHSQPYTGTYEYHREEEINSTLTTVNFGDKVTIIPDNFLRNCRGVETLTIPKSVEKIGAYALANVESNTLYYNAENCEISNYGIWYDHGSNGDLTRVIIGDGVKNVPNNLLWNCFNIAELSIPKSVTNIEVSAFRNCRFDTVYYDAKNCQFNTERTSPFASAKALNIGENVESLPNNAFAECSNLRRINYNAINAKSIAASTFDRCDVSSIIIGSKVKSIPNYTFNGCVKIDTIHCRAEVPPTTYENFVPNYSSKLVVSLDKRKTYEKTEPWSKFANIEELSVAGSYKIGGFCYNLYEDNTAGITYLEKDSTNYESFIDADVVVPEKVAYNGFEFYVNAIEDYAFNGVSMSSIELPKTITKIGDSAFKLTYLRNITLPDSLTWIGDSVFYSCYFKDIKLPNTLKYIGKGAFESTHIKDLVIPNSVDSIGSSAFAFCGYLESITLPKSLKKINESTFQYCHSLESIELPDSLEEISTEAFYRCANLRSITIPKFVTILSEEVFRECTSLETVALPDGLKEILDDAFLACVNLKSINLPQTLKKIGESAFNSCRSLETIELPESLEEISAEAFYGCANLRNITIPKSIITLSKSLFASCTSLETVVLTDGLEKIQDYAFRNCTNLRNIKLPNSITRIYPLAFSNCSSLESIEWPSKCTRVDNPFYNCTDLRKIVFPSRISYAYCDFTGCENLDTLICKAPEPPTFIYSNIDVDKCKVFVPEYCVHKYKEDEAWGKFIIEPLACLKVKVDDLYYIICEDGTATVTAEYPNDTHNYANSQLGKIVKVPSTITYEGATYTVTQVGDYAFSCNDSDYSEREIYLPETIEYIGGGAFLHACKSVHCAAPYPPRINQSELPDYFYVDYEALDDYYKSNYDHYVKELCGEDLRDRSILEVMGLSFKTLKNSRQAVFVGADSSMSEVIIPNCIYEDGIKYEVTQIAEGVLEHNEVVRSVEIPNAVKHIGIRAFSDCINLETVHMPDSLTIVSSYAFYGCQSLQSIRIPAKVTLIRNYTFYNCPNLSTIYCEPIEYPEAINIVESDRRSNITVYVPEESYSKYHACWWWDDYNLQSYDFSSVDEVVPDNNKVDVVIKDGVLIVNGVEPQTPIEIYSFDGRCIYRGPYEQVETLPRGLMIIRIFNNAFKVKI